MLWPCAGNPKNKSFWFPFKDDPRRSKAAYRFSFWFPLHPKTAKTRCVSAAVSAVRKSHEVGHQFLEVVGVGDVSTFIDGASCIRWIRMYVFPPPPGAWVLLDSSHFFRVSLHCFSQTWAPRKGGVPQFYNYEFWTQDCWETFNVTIWNSRFNMSKQCFYNSGILNLASH